MFCIKSSNVNSLITLNEHVQLSLKRLGVFEKNTAVEISDLLHELDHREYINITNAFSAKSGKFFPLTGPNKAFQKFLLILRSQISRMEDERAARMQHSQQAMRNMMSDLQQVMGQALLESGLHRDSQPPEVAAPIEVVAPEPPQTPYDVQPVEYTPLEYEPMQYNALANNFSNNNNAPIEHDTVADYSDDSELIEDQQFLHLPERNMNVLQQISQQRDDINKLIAAIAAADVEEHAVMICGDISEEVFEIITIEIRPHKKVLGSEVRINVETIQFRVYRNCNFRKGLDASTSEDEFNSVSADMTDNST